VTCPIPPKSIVLWDAKYRKPGGRWPTTLNPSTFHKWKLALQLAAGNFPSAKNGTLAKSLLTHINGSLGELRAYGILCDNGHVGLSAPRAVTEKGVDFVTYFHGPHPLHDLGTEIRTALESGAIVGRVFKWPECIISG
jgi:hypothetical protein